MRVSATTWACSRNVNWRCLHMETCRHLGARHGTYVNATLGYDARACACVCVFATASTIDKRIPGSVKAYHYRIAVNKTRIAAARSLACLLSYTVCDHSDQSIRVLLLIKHGSPSLVDESCHELAAAGNRTAARSLALTIAEWYQHGPSTSITHYQRYRDAIHIPARSQYCFYHNITFTHQPQHSLTLRVVTKRYHTCGSHRCTGCGSHRHVCVCMREKGSLVTLSHSSERVPPHMWVTQLQGDCLKGSTGAGAVGHTHTCVCVCVRSLVYCLIHSSKVLITTAQCTCCLERLIGRCSHWKGLRQLIPADTHTHTQRHRHVNT